jgi:hypothetical protein
MACTPEGVTIVDPSKYVAAAAPGRCPGLVRVVTVNQPRIGAQPVSSNLELVR